jgi:hypothetical protein
LPATWLSAIGFALRLTQKIYQAKKQGVPPEGMNPFSSKLRCLMLTGMT